MNRNSQRWKKWVRGTLIVLLALDAVLLVINWRAAQAAPRAQFDERDLLKGQAKQLADDVARNQGIQDRMDEVRRKSDRFYSEQLVDASTGYSSIVADLGEIAANAGLKTSGVGFRQKELKDRGVIEIQITAAVEGDYPSLIHFINGLERSRKFYLLDDLTLASAGTSSIKLNLELRTYFRS